MLCRRYSKSTKIAYTDNRIYNIHLALLNIKSGKRSQMVLMIKSLKYESELVKFKYT